MKFFRKRLVYGIGQTRGFTGQQLRDAKACSDVFHSDVFHFWNDELNGIFKIVCEPACWIFPKGDESCIRDGLHAFGQQAELLTWPN